MLLIQLAVPENEFVDQIAGITGFGWTASVLGYFITVIGYGNSAISRLVVEPRSLLYVGTILFIVTIGLDRFQETLVDPDS